MAPSFCLPPPLCLFWSKSYRSPQAEESSEEALCAASVCLHLLSPLGPCSQC